MICVHGHEGTPELVAGFLSEEILKKDIYRAFGRTAVRRGYVVWCPMIMSYYSEEREPQEGPEAKGRDLLHKKALLTGRSLMGLEVAKIRRAVDYLETLPEVDRRRIGIYGLSKGGHYTLYTAGIETRLKAVVVSGWFNDRVKKVTGYKTPGESHAIHHPPAPLRILSARSARPFRRCRAGLDDRAPPAAD